jgi:superfamily II DNA/RNA helicase
MKFEELNLNEQIIRAIHACGYTDSTQIQAQAIPVILAGKDLVASAPTGSGKTAAFVLPVIEKLLKQVKHRLPRILILTPTRELATQITTAARQYGKYLKFKMASIVGGSPYGEQIRQLSQTLDIIVATPGRLMDHMERNRVNLSEIETLILDEADRMLDMGFIDDVKKIASHTPAHRQTLLFSATVDRQLDGVVRQLLSEPARIDLSEKITSSQIQQELYRVDDLKHKVRLLQHFLNETKMYKAIIFSATKRNADNLAQQLRAEGHLVSALHGDLKQNVRTRTLDQLRHGKIQYLVATDVAARGIDVQDITHVINFDLPKFSEDYVHRIGRTGRAGKTGIAISFALPEDNRQIRNIEKYVGQQFSVMSIPGLESKRPTSNAPSSDRPKKRFGGKNGKPAFRFKKKKPFKSENRQAAF